MKTNFLKSFYSTLYIIFTVSMVLQSRQNMKKINVFNPLGTVPVIGRAPRKNIGYGARDYTS
jgi:hypothetical protein